MIKGVKDNLTVIVIELFYILSSFTPLIMAQNLSTIQPINYSTLSYTFGPQKHLKRK